MEVHQQGCQGINIWFGPEQIWMKKIGSSHFQVVGIKGLLYLGVKSIMEINYQNRTRRTKWIFPGTWWLKEL